MVEPPPGPSPCPAASVASKPSQSSESQRKQSSAVVKCTCGVDEQRTARSHLKARAVVSAAFPAFHLPGRNSCKPSQYRKSQRKGRLSHKGRLSRQEPICRHAAIPLHLVEMASLCPGIQRKEANSGCRQLRSKRVTSSAPGGHQVQKGSERDGMIMSEVKFLRYLST